MSRILEFPLLSGALVERYESFLYVTNVRSFLVRWLVGNTLKELKNKIRN